jgi:hypothetical protein
MSGGSYYSQNSFVLHFGLGAVTEVDGIAVRWPDGSVQKVGRQGVDGTVRITEPK